MVRPAWLLPASFALAAAGCMSSSTRHTLAAADTAADARPALAPPADTTKEAPALRPPSEAALGRQVDLRSLEAAALARSPELVEAAHRVRAIAAEARAEGSLPAPELMAQLWQVPLSRPYALGDAGMLMFALRQEIPPAGSLAQAADATAQEARAAAAMVVVRARGIVREVDRTFADYVEATERHHAHVEHMAIVEQMAAQARARYATGGALADFTKADLERVRLEADLAREQGSIDGAKAKLNGLLARPIDAPLGAPVVGAPMTIHQTAAQIAERAAAKNPEIAAADALRDAARRSADSLDRQDSVPTFRVGLDYFAPVGGAGSGWGAELGMSLPWLWGGAANRTESAEHRALAEAAAASGARIRVKTEAARALASVSAAERRFALLDGPARTAARHALEASAAGYASGRTDVLMWLDVERSSLDVALERIAARGELDRALADLDWAVGEPVPRTPIDPISTTGGRP